MNGNDFVDRLRGGNGPAPVFLRDMTLGMDVLGVRTADVICRNMFDAGLSAECICAFAERTGQEAVIGCCHSPAFIIEQFGGEMKYPEYGIPVPLTHPLEGVTDFSGCDSVPAGKAVKAIESYALVKRRLKDRAVVANVTGPLTKAGVVAGIEWVSMLTESDRDVLDSLLALCLENTKAVVEAMVLDASIDAGLLAAATDNPDLFGEELFAEIAVPWTRRFCDVFLKNGLPVIWHPHGRMFTEDSDMADLVRKSGCSCFHYAENNDLGTMRRTLDMPLMGGTDIVPTLMNGDADRIRSETLMHLETFRDMPYIFSASCSMHRGVPLENVDLMMETVRDFS